MSPRNPNPGPKLQGIYASHMYQTHEGRKKILTMRKLNHVSASSVPSLSDYKDGCRAPSNRSTACSPD